MTDTPKPLNSSNSKNNILILYTGGTFGMQEDAVLGALKPFHISNLNEYIPEINSIDIQLDILQMSEIKDSSDFDLEDWRKLAQAIDENYSIYNSFIIIHGTDTMAYTASALSFMLQGLDKPIIFTGAQKPLSFGNSDASSNLLGSIEICMAHIKNKVFLPEVYLFFGGLLLRANRSTKVDTESFVGFDSPHVLPITKFKGGELLFTETNTNRIPKQFSFHVSNKVGFISFYPGLNVQTLEFFLSYSNFQVVIIEAFGTGNLPSNVSKSISNYIKEGGRAYVISQCSKGKVNQTQYKSGSFLFELGVIGLGDMTKEAALTKAMFLLANGKLDKMTTNLVREISL